MAALNSPLLTNHNRCWIWGRNTVLETLRAGRWPVLEFLYSDRCEANALDEALALANERNIPFDLMRDAEITKKCRSEDHQGLAARMPPFPYRDLQELLAELPENPLLVMLDRKDHKVQQVQMVLLDHRVQLVLQVLLVQQVHLEQVLAILVLLETNSLATETQQHLF